MTDTELRQNLHAIHEAITVPPVDQVVFDGRVRRARRRRRGVQALVGATAVAAVATAFAVVVPHLGDRSDPTTYAAAPDPGVAVVLGGRVELLAADGTLTDTGLAGRPLGRLDGREVVLSGHRLLGLTDGVIDGVATAFVDRTGVTYETTTGAIHWTGTRGQDSAWMDGTLLGAGEHAFVVTGESTDLVVHDAEGLHPVDLGSDGNAVEPDRVEVGGFTVAVVADGTVQFFGADGTRGQSFLGGENGALSADGDTYAFAPSAREAAAGMEPGLAFFDVASGHQERVPLTGQALDLDWIDGDLYVVTQQGDAHVLQECTRQGCVDRLTDPTGTLSLR
ncbi:hypothetical protein ABLE68_20115 [Nocardioides sp. CN2-186]|uniref:hypothetical protein n=1 Tax=Nocardioides tweenelious TaxID=3156607 RepID=UPI0032B54681